MSREPGRIVKRTTLLGGHVVCEFNRPLTKPEIDRLNWEDEQAAYEEYEREEAGVVGLIAAILMGVIIGTSLIGWLAYEITTAMGY